MQKDQLCANKISEIVQLARERVNGNQSRTPINSKVDEVGDLQKFLGRYE